MKVAVIAQAQLNMTAFLAAVNTPSWGITPIVFTVESAQQNAIPAQTRQHAQAARQGISLTHQYAKLIAQQELTMDKDSVKNALLDAALVFQHQSAWHAQAAN